MVIKRMLGRQRGSCTCSRARRIGGGGCWWVRSGVDMGYARGEGRDGMWSACNDSLVGPAFGVGVLGAPLQGGRWRTGGWGVTPQKNAVDGI